MTEKITFGDLHRLLEECGFVQAPKNGPYVVFKHDASGALQAFRSHRTTEMADPMALASVRKTLVEFGFMDESEFAAAIREAVTGRKAKLS
jgi:predicted RNA binding protein YcfA (HicA-like mRNA interferase family)